MANKKINQLVSKTSILSTDLFGIGDATTGQLFKKTIAELQAAIGGAVISVNGLVGTVVLDTDDIQELATPTNKWFTDARARAAISLTVTGSSGASTYSSGTGVLNIPTYTLAGLGGITATFLSGGTGISYNSTTGVISYSGTVYTDASIRALFSGSTGITYNSTTGAISYSGTVYTDSSVRALISLTTTGDSGASTYNNTTGVINVPNYTLAGLGGISLTSLSGGTGITYNNTTGAISYSGTVYTDSSIRALISASGAVSYNNTTGVISLTSGNLTEATSSVLTITGGTGAILGSGTSIQVKQASSTVSGFLSSTDWNTFNDKASALSGTTGYHAKFTSSTAIGNSALFESGGNLLLGTTTASGFDKALVFNSATSTSGLLFQLAGVDKGFVYSGGGELYLGSNSNNILLYTNGSERMRITSTGLVGVGTTTPGNLLHILSAAGTQSVIQIGQTARGTAVIGMQAASSVPANMVIGTDVTGNIIFKQGITTSDLSTGTERMRITSAGNVGIGTTSPSARLNVSGIDSGTSIRLDHTSSYSMLCGYINGASLIAMDNLSGSLAYYLGGSERMRITSGGNILMGTATDNGERLYVSGAIRATGTITSNSDITLKKNLLKIENALEKVEQINGYTYEFKADDSKRHAGVIAQEIQTVLPEIVNKGNDGILGVEYGNISALLIEAIKEQQTQIKELKALLNK
jgi:hypothetical protein